MKRAEVLYRNFQCPKCNAPGMCWIPEAPGSDEGKRCLKCGRVWAWWPTSGRRGAIIIDRSSPPWWCRLRDWWSLL